MDTYKTCSYLIHLSTNKTFHWDANFDNIILIWNINCKLIVIPSVSYFWPILWILFIFNDRISLQIWSSSLFTCLHTSTTNPLHTYYGRDSEEHVTLMSFLFSPNNNKPSTNVGLAKSSIQVLWVPQLSSSKSSLQPFYHWNMSEKGNAQRIKKTTSSHWRRLFCAKSWKPSIPTKINVSSVFLNLTILILVRIYF